MPGAFEPAPVPALRVRTCRLCSRALSGLQQARGDLCDAMDCRRLAVDAELRARRDATLDAARQGAARQWAMPALLQAPVVWLADHDRGVVPSGAAERAEQRAFLLGLACAAHGPDLPPETGPADGGTGPTAGNRLCAMCGGRCCHTGARQYAWLRSAQLRRWLAGHPGATWPEAVDDYMSRVAARHVDNSCLHHGERGCTLPREMRSDTCNDYACDPLERVDALARPNPGVAVVAAIVRQHRLVDAALLSARDSRPLPGVARPE